MDTISDNVQRIKLSGSPLDDTIAASQCRLMLTQKERARGLELRGKQLLDVHTAKELVRVGLKEQYDDEHWWLTMGIESAIAEWLSRPEPRRYVLGVDDDRLATHYGVADVLVTVEVAYNPVVETYYLVLIVQPDGQHVAYVGTFTELEPMEPNYGNLYECVRSTLASPDATLDVPISRILDCDSRLGNVFDNICQALWFEEEGYALSSLDSLCPVECNWAWKQLKSAHRFPWFTSTIESIMRKLNSDSPVLEDGFPDTCRQRRCPCKIYTRCQYKKKA